MSRSALQARLDVWRAKVPLVFRGTKFMLIAWLGMVVNTGYLYLFKGILGIRLIPASFLAIEIAIVHNFIWYRYWAWKDRKDIVGQPFFRQLFKYNVATGLVDLCSNVTVLWVLSTFLHVHYLLANVCGMIAGPFIKYWLNDKFIFREKRHAPPR